jgi:hypothetical protein
MWRNNYAPRYGRWQEGTEKASEGQTEAEAESRQEKGQEVIM